MRSTVFALGSRFVQPETTIVDLGCSRGEALAPFVERYGAANTFRGFEIAPSMLEAASARFDGYIKAGVVGITKHDLRYGFPILPARSSLTLAVLTLQFVPMEYRQRLLAGAYKSTVPGGAIIVVEKVLGATSKIDELMTSEYYDLKRQHHYSQDAIDRKRLALEGVLVPVTAAWNEELLRQGGFREIDCFWRWCNFAAWVAIK